MTTRCVQPYPQFPVSRLSTRQWRNSAPGVTVTWPSAPRCDGGRFEHRLFATVADEGTERQAPTARDAVYDALSGHYIWRVYPQEKVPVTSLWSGTEKCALVFARSMGCVFCQEYARQLTRDVLPELEGTGIRFFLVSIGPPERGIEFSELTGFPQSQLLADPANAVYDAVGFHRNIQRTFFDVRTPLKIFGRAFQKDRGADLVEATRKWKMWIPPKGEQALQQGGILLFKGETCVFQRADRATADHLVVQELLKIILKN